MLSTAYEPPRASMVLATPDSCATICYMDASSPHDYDSTDRTDHGDFDCWLTGTLTCDSSCRISTSSCSNNVCGDSFLYGNLYFPIR